MDIGLEDRLQMFSNGGEVLNQFEKMFKDLETNGIPAQELG